ncbi:MULTISPECIES: thiamine pyrophosphate-binding protein [unclassified Paenibacillus]|uniref:thiamine pyrophosphate-binding protein n=1 Tax=unclassified Paenibacillus TaxID=185978 RepID=UPI0009564972|nr:MULTISPECIES: thiamine pyrophosphate-binding protein [unclassified Paenibacillus]ASS68536.1 thiamine pyrophosphate-binding protein [Paenibacillus sp. RUD330]SIR62967.1 acetolactate synthase-1/2/3 large subunit [Paenibacillus sp. RU4X]SIR71481.1 acetolactate synthase-1/2/3 large subunit [Paenibacillus sp. RU4T]
MKLAEAMLRYLKSAGVEHLFGIPAGIIGPIYDSLIDVGIKPVIAKNEAGSAYTAARYSSTSGRLSVCAGAGAVGVSNMMNGIADAKRAKAPMLVIAGGINRWQMGKGAIQELDGEQMVKGVTKYSATVLREQDVLAELDKAVRIALTPPCGPVYLCIPIDIQRLDLDMPIPEAPAAAEFAAPLPDPASLEHAAALIRSARKGLIMVGRGGRGFGDGIRQLSEKLQWPVITTPAGKGIVSGDFPLNLGNYGFSSTEAASRYVNSAEPDCVLVLGSSLGEASTCNFNDVLVAGRKLIHVDRDPSELGKVFRTDAAVRGDLKEVLPCLLNAVQASSSRYIREEPVNAPYELNHTGMSLRLFLENLKDTMPSDTRYVCDIGEFTNFALKYIHVPDGGDFEINLDYGAMGSAISGAPGLALADPSRPVAVVAGDGCFFMNGMDILTAKEYRIPVVYFVINNAMLSYVERGQQFLFSRSIPDYKQERISIAAMMEAAGVRSMSVESIEEMAAIPSFLEGLDGPCLIEVITDGTEPAPILDRLKALVVN